MFIKFKKIELKLLKWKKQSPDVQRLLAKSTNSYTQQKKEFKNAFSFKNKSLLFLVVEFPETFLNYTMFINIWKIKQIKYNHTLNLLVIGVRC